MAVPAVPACSVVDSFWGLLYSHLAREELLGQLRTDLLGSLQAGLKGIAARRRQRAAGEGRRPLMAEGHPHV